MLTVQFIGDGDKTGEGFTDQWFVNNVQIMMFIDF